MTSVNFFVAWPQYNVKLSRTDAYTQSHPCIHAHKLPNCICWHFQESIHNITFHALSVYTWAQSDSSPPHFSLPVSSTHPPPHPLLHPHCHSLSALTTNISNLYSSGVYWHSLLWRIRSLTLMCGQSTARQAPSSALRLEEWKKNSPTDFIIIHRTLKPHPQKRHMSQRQPYGISGGCDNEPNTLQENK